jgi:PKD domain
MSGQDSSNTTPSHRRRTKGTRVLLASAAVLAVGLTPVATATATATASPSSPPPTCQASTAGGPLFITANCVDPVLNEPYIDADHSGTITDPTTNVTVSFRYIHGGFTGTNARFSFYFPAPDQYRGRFFENTYPTLGLNTEDAAPGCPAVGASACSVAFAVSNGAYVVSTNNAGGVPAGGALAPYRANAAAAKYSRVVAEEMVYGTSQRPAARPRGYIYGASGGAYQTVGAMENTSGVWDGAVPQVFGVPNAIPSFMTVELLALRLLGDKLPQIAAASEPGGSGNPYAGLDPQQQAALHEVSRLGFPLRGWWQYATLNGGAFLATEGLPRALDPTYMNDFWTLPGYEGTDPSVQAARIQYATSVVGSAGGSGLVLAHVPAGDLDGADLIVTSGSLAGQSIPIVSVSGDTVELVANPGIAPGTNVTLDNSWLIALQYYQRHQVPTPDEYGWNQYRGPDGLPLEPQRSLLVGPIAAASTAGSIANGHFYGKMIMLGSVMDVQAYPWSEDWYRKQAQAALGSNFADSYRLWYMDNADHDPNGPAATNAADAADHIVSYLGEVEQALLDLDAWVSQGVQPPASSNYSINSDDQVQLPATPAQRRGVQPVVTLSAKGHGAPGESIDVAAGQPVTFSVKAQVPPGTGKIVEVQWDFLGADSYPVSSQLSHIGPVVNVKAPYTFTQPGTYYPTVRVASQQTGDTTTPFGLIQNLARVRVVVH